MRKIQIRNSLLLVLTALIWGTAFVAQSEGGDAIGPFSFNCIRSLIAAVVLIPVILVLDKMKLTSRKPKTAEDHKKLWKGGILCGLSLFVASSLQQLGINLGTDAGKAGFLTACYILIVPLLGLFMKKKCSWNIWIGVAMTLVGLYLLCFNGSLTFKIPDILLLLCAFCFSIQILLIDRYSPVVDGVRLSCIQFLVTGVLSLIPMSVLEIGQTSTDISMWVGALSSWEAWIPLLYAAVFSSGVAYTLQIIAQNGLNPTLASLLMSLESVFAVLAGWVILNQHLTFRELMGCIVIFAAIVLAQIPVKKKLFCKKEETCISN